MCQKNFSSAWGATRLVPDSILANYYALSARNIARLAHPRVSWASVEPPAHHRTDGLVEFPNATTFPSITTRNSSSPSTPWTQVDWEIQLPCYDPRSTVKLAMSAESIFAAQRMGFVGRTVQIVSLVCELLALLLVLAAAAVFVFCVDETNSSGAASTTADRREKVSRKWEKVQLFVLQKRRKQLNTRLITHQALLLCAMAMYLAGAFLMIWWKPTIVRPLVAASFEAHARIVQFEVSEIFERAEQFSLMTSSALTLDNVFNLTSSAVAASVSGDDELLSLGSCLQLLDTESGAAEQCLFGYNFVRNSTIQLKLLQFFASVTHDFVAEILLVPSSNSFVQVSRYTLEDEDDPGDVDTEYIKLIRARTVNIADANTASVSCQVDLAMPGDGGSGIAAQDFYKEIDDNDENGSTFYNGTIDVPDSVCAAMYTQSVASELAGWSEVRQFNISRVQSYFPHMEGTARSKLITSYVSKWDTALSLSSGTAFGGDTSSPVQQLDSFVVFGGDLHAISVVLEGESTLWEGTVAYLSQDQYGGLLIAASTSDVVHENGYRLEAEDSGSLLVSKTATSLHAWHSAGMSVLASDWMLEEWYSNNQNATSSSAREPDPRGSVQDDSACAPILDTSGSAIFAHAGYLTARGAQQVPTPVSLLPYIMPSINGRRFKDSAGSISVGVADGLAGAGTSLEEDLRFCFVTSVPIKHQLLIREASEALLCLVFSVLLCFGIFNVGRVAFNHGRRENVNKILRVGSWKTKHGSVAYYEELDEKIDEFREALGDLSSRERIERASMYIESLNDSDSDSTKRVARELYYDRTSIKWPLTLYDIYSSNWYSLVMHLACLVLIVLIAFEPPNAELACARPAFYVGVDACNTSLIWEAESPPKWVILLTVEAVTNTFLLVDIVIRALTYGIGSWAPIKNVDDHFKPERRDVTMTRFAFQSLLWLDFVMAAIWGPFEYMRFFRFLRPLLYIWRFEPYRNSLMHFFQTVTGVGSVIALVFIVIFVGATIARAGFEGSMSTSPDTEFQLLVLNVDTGFQAFLTMFTLMTTGENIMDLVYGVSDTSQAWLREYLAPFLFFPLCMVGIYLLAGLMIAGFQEEFMQRFMDKVDKRERKFDDVCAYAYALLDTNESGSLSHSEFRSFIKNIMAKRTRYDLQECCGGGETAPEDTSAIPPNKVIPIDLRRDGSKDGTHIQGAQVQAALKWKNKAKDKVSEKESQEAALVDSVFDVITFDPNAMDDDVDDGVVATEAAASKAETNTNASSAAKVQSNTHRRLSLMHGSNHAEYTAGDDHVPLQQFIHIVKKWNSFRQHYTVKELAVALQFFVSGSGAGGTQATAGRSKGQASARSVANRLWFGKFLYGPVGRARVAVQAIIANPIFTWATTTCSIFYVPLLGFTVSVLDTPINDDVHDDDAIRNTTANGEAVLSWSEAVYWTEYIVWAFLVLFAVEFALKLFAHTPLRFWNHYDLGLRYINRVDLTMFCSCTTAYVISLTMLNAQRTVFELRFIWLSVVSLRTTFLVEKVRKSVIMMGIAMPHFASILMVHVALLLLFALMCMEMLGGKFSPVFNTEPVCHFDNLGASMTTFFTLMIGEGWQYVMIKGIDGNLQMELLMVFFVVYTMMATLIIVNLMMGIVVDLVVSLQSASEKELWFDSAKALTDKYAAKSTVVHDPVLAVLLRKQKIKSKKDKSDTRHSDHINYQNARSSIAALVSSAPHDEGENVLAAEDLAALERPPEEAIGPTFSILTRALATYVHHKQKVQRAKAFGLDSSDSDLDSDLEAAEKLARKRERRARRRASGSKQTSSSDTSSSDDTEQKQSDSRGKNKKKVRKSKQKTNNEALPNGQDGEDAKQVEFPVPTATRQVAIAVGANPDTVATAALKEQEQRLRQWEARLQRRDAELTSREQRLQRDQTQLQRDRQQPLRSPSQAPQLRAEDHNLKKTKKRNPKSAAPVNTLPEGKLTIGGFGGSFEERAEKMQRLEAKIEKRKDDEAKRRKKWKKKITKSPCCRSNCQRWRCAYGLEQQSAETA
eukprot:INCI16381.2.p1 GENE.INCI16381.2~~INCI16381.2.p1  ORF type:complete len:2023 (-),score=362.65 INCI16381.2:125-6193(-)